MESPWKLWGMTFFPGIVVTIGHSRHEVWRAPGIGMRDQWWVMVTLSRLNGYGNEVDGMDMIIILRICRLNAAPVSPSLLLRESLEGLGNIIFPDHCFFHYNGAPNAKVQWVLHAFRIRPIHAEEVGQEDVPQREGAWLQREQAKWRPSPLSNTWVNVSRFVLQYCWALMLYLLCFPTSERKKLLVWGILIYRFEIAQCGCEGVCPFRVPESLRKTNPSGASPTHSPTQIFFGFIVCFLPLEQKRSRAKSIRNKQGDKTLWAESTMRTDTTWQSVLWV